MSDITVVVTSVGTNQCHVRHRRLAHDHPEELHEGASLQLCDNPDIKPAIVYSVYKQSSTQDPEPPSYHVIASEEDFERLGEYGYDQY